MSSASVFSRIPSISDVVGYNSGDYHFPSISRYSSAQSEDWGFDPPSRAGSDYGAYSPRNGYSSQWPEFTRERECKPCTQSPVNLNAYEMDKFITSTLPNTMTAVSRFGQMTPPRSSPSASAASKEEKLSPKSLPAEPRTRGKARIKQAETIATTPAKTTTAGRKRRSRRKVATTNKQETAPEDHRRKRSLEKNRVAAAKCRINKKEKTERMRRDSRDKAVENAYLKMQVMRMKEEVQQINTILGAHANCDGCKSPKEIHAHLTALGNQFSNQQLNITGHNDEVLQQVNFAGLPVLPDGFFSGSAAQSMLHTPLPEFNLSADFEVHTPVPTD